jgi:hypothetical protein
MSNLPVSSLEKLENDLKTVDVTKLVEYSKKVKDIAGLNKMMAPLYIRDFIQAYDVANTMLSVAVRYDIQAQTALDNVRSIAYLDKAGDFLKDRGIKDTSEARKQYVDMDQDVLKASDIKAKTTALVSFLKNKLQEFRMAHDDIKKMVYSDSYNTPDEGF